MEFTESPNLVTKLGYEIGTGSQVNIPLRHTAVTGQTQESGKTTTLEAVITRSGLRAIAFLTKRGEKSFRLMTPVPVYFREPVIAPETPLWRWIESIFETVGESVGREEKAAIIQASEFELEAEIYTKNKEIRKRLKATKTQVQTLCQVAENVELMLDVAKGKMQTALTCLNAYFKIVIPQINDLKSVKRLELAPGLNVMDLESVTDEMQMLIIRSVLEEVYRKRRNIVVIIPESAKFIPRARQSPVRFAAEMFIRQGLGIGNVLMLDSQDLANVATEVLKNVGVWILGKQGEINEVKRVVNYIPSNPKIQPDEVMRLDKGQFFAVFSGQVKKVYVQPAGMEDVHAQAIARGEESADSWKQIVRQLDDEGRLSHGPDGETDIRDFATMEQAIQDEIDIPTPAFISSRPPGYYMPENDPVLERGREWDGDRTDMIEPPISRTEPKLELLQRLEQVPPEESEGKMETGFTEAEWDAQVENLKTENQQLRNEVARLTKIISPSTGSPVAAPRQDHPPINLEVKSIALNGNMAEFLRRLREHPEVIALLREVPTVQVSVTRPVITWDYSSVGGKIAKLFSEGFFKSAKNGPDVARELKRRGCSTPTTNVYKPLEKMAEMGFVTVEPDGFLAVPGMKIDIKNA